VSANRFAPRRAPAARRSRGTALRGRRRAPREVGIALLAVVGVPAAVALASFGGGDGAPEVRAQYGGHGGAPQVKTGAVGRLALDGRWRVALDPAATGGKRGFQRGRFGGKVVRVPYVPNAMKVTGAAGIKSHNGSVAWYRTTLRVPKTGRYALRFESVNHTASVYLDGRRLGAHTGTYLPFELRPRLRAGRDHTLVVRADWRDPLAMKATGWHRTWFNFGGINREVTIRPLGRAQLEAPAIITRVRDGAARVQVGVDARNFRGGREVVVTGKLRRGDRTVDLEFPSAAVPGRGGVERVRASAVIDDPALWSPESPALWDLELRVDGEPAWSGRVGLREVRRAGPRILLNGRPVRMRGASLHEDAPGRGDGLRSEDEAALVAQLRSLGANATRAQHPLSPSLMEKLDEAGILIWMGIGPVDAPGAWTSKGPRLAAQARQRVRENFEQLQIHPSIVAWNLANEVAGQGHPDGQAPFIDASARFLRKHDPGRLVALDIWGSHPPKFDGPMYRNIDAIGWTNYLGWYEEPYASPARLRQLIRTKLGALRRVFPDRVIAVTEFGAEGNRRNPRGAPGGYDFQARLLRTHIRTYGAMPDLAGMLVWNLRDFAVAPSFAGGSIRRVVDQISLLRGLNEKGLLSYTGRPKPAARAVKSEFARIR
jgi:hypothetical protein